MIEPDEYGAELLADAVDSILQRIAKSVPEILAASAEKKVHWIAALQAVLTQAQEAFDVTPITVWIAYFGCAECADREDCENWQRWLNLQQEEKENEEHVH